MKKSLAFLLMLSMVAPFSTSAQKNKIRFNSINQFAAVGGESQVNTAFQTVNGVRFSDWFAGVGIGIDNYRYKTLPLFADVRWFFGDEKKAFVYGDIGYNFPMKDTPGKEIPYYNTYHFTGGIYTDLGIGYTAPLYKKSSLLFSLGYSYKNIKIRTGDLNPFNGYSYETYDLGFNRILLKAGLIF